MSLRRFPRKLLHHSHQTSQERDAGQPPSPDTSPPSLGPSLRDKSQASCLPNQPWAACDFFIGSQRPGTGPRAQVRWLPRLALLRKVAAQPVPAPWTPSWMGGSSGVARVLTGKEPGPVSLGLQAAVTCNSGFIKCRLQGCCWALEGWALPPLHPTHPGAHPLLSLWYSGVTPPPPSAPPGHTPLQQP